MKKIGFLMVILIFISCSPTTRTALNIKKSTSSKFLNIEGSYIDDNSRFYLYENNLVVRLLLGSGIDINFLKNQNYPDGYGWYFIEGDKITIQFWVRGEGSPYVVVEHIGKITHSNRFVIEKSRQFSSSLFGNSNIVKDVRNVECIFRSEVKPDSLNPWVPIDSISYKKALGKSVWKKKFNGI
jgi:predicted small secreted protein